MTKESRYSRAERGLAWLTLAIFLIGPMPAAATETALGKALASYGRGEFTINEYDRTEYTQHTRAAILDWSVDIQQPDYHSLEFRQEDNYVILNRSPGERASNFFGSVICDATCIFANEAGITFQNGSYIDVGRMIAVAGSIATADFVNGNLHFTNLTGPQIRSSLFISLGSITIGFRLYRCQLCRSTFNLLAIRYE